MKISECAELFLSYIQDKSPNTLRSYRTDLNQFIQIVGDKDVESVTKADIAKFRMILQAKKKRSSTIARKLACINSFFEYLIDLELVKVSPVTKSHRPKISQKIPSSLSHEEIRIILSSLKNLQEKVIILIPLATGLRSSEILGIKRKDIKVSRDGRLYELSTVLESGFKDGDILFLRVIGKGNKEREVPLIGEPAKVLIEYIKTHSFDRVLPISYHMFWYRIVEIGKRVGIELHPHKLRHTAATLALQSGAELRVIQELLGHSSPVTTARYAKVGQKQLVDATKNLVKKVFD